MTDLTFISCLDINDIQKILKKSYQNRYEAEKDLVLLFKKKGIIDPYLHSEEGLKLLNLEPWEVSEIHKDLFEHRNHYLNSVKEIALDYDFKNLPNDIVLKLNFKIKDLLSFKHIPLNLDLIIILSKQLQLQNVTEFLVGNKTVSAEDMIEDFPERKDFIESQVLKKFMEEYENLDYDYALNQAIMKRDIGSVQRIYENSDVNEQILKYVPKILKNFRGYDYKVNSFLFSILKVFEDNINNPYLRTYITNSINLLSEYYYNDLVNHITHFYNNYIDNQGSVLGGAIKSCNLELYEKYKKDIFKNDRMLKLLPLAYYCGDKHIIEYVANAVEYVPGVKRSIRTVNTTSDLETSIYKNIIYSGNLKLLEDVIVSDVDYRLYLSYFDLSKLDGIVFAVESYHINLEIDFEDIIYISEDVINYLLDNGLISLFDILLFKLRTPNQDVRKYSKRNIDVSKEHILQILDSDNIIYDNFKILLDNINLTKKDYCYINTNKTKDNFYFDKLIYKRCK